MSNHWDLKCRGCDADAGFHCNDDPRKLLQLWKEAKAWSSLHGTWSWGEVTENLGGPKGEWFPFGEWHSFPDFAHEHLGHDVVPWSEYGYAFDECAEHFRCKACGAAKTCRLKKKHKGEHSEKPEAL